MTPKHLHFIGICGVAMSALAIAFKRAGHTVSGSDVGFYPPVSTNLKNAEVAFYPGWHPEHVLHNFAKGGKNNPENLIVVVGGVAGSTNPELNFALQNNFHCVSYPELVRDFFVKKNSIVCAGTFGKSTSATLLAWILTESGLNPSYMFGSIAENAHFPPAMLVNSDYSVIEGDEYKASRTDPGPKFAYYKPTHLLLTSVVWDHADVYPSEALYRAAFQKLVNSIPNNGTIVISEKATPIVILTRRLAGKNPLANRNTPPSNQGDPSALRPQDDNAPTVITYGKHAGNTYAYSDVEQTRAGINFIIRFGTEVYHVSTKCLGEYMADNITGCFAVARSLGIAPERIIAAVKSFAGVRRRLEKRFEGSVTVFDDIAHSPQKVQAVLASLKAVYPKRIFAVFEPNTGNREVASGPGYAHAFRDADEVIIPHLTKLKIDATKQAPMDGAALADVIRATHPSVTYCPEDPGLLKLLKEKTRPGDVVVFLGSHGFRGMIEEFVKQLSS